LRIKREEELQMNHSKQLRMAILLILIASILLGGCQNQVTILPGDIVAKAIESDKNISKMYSEFHINTYENNVLKEVLKCKQCDMNSNGIMKKRLEMDSSVEGNVITVNDGVMLKSYSKKENQVVLLNISKLGLGAAVGQKEQFMKFMEQMQKTHKITNKGEARMNGFDTYHILAEPNEKNSLMGITNCYIDKENWIVIKTTSEMGNTRTEVEYTKIDMNPTINEELFRLDYPKTAKIMDMDKQEKSKTKIISMKEVLKLVGKPILLLPKSSGFIMDKIEDVKMNAEHEEITMDYFNGKNPAFSVTIIHNNKSTADKNQGDEPEAIIEPQVQAKAETDADNNLLGSKPVKIRGCQADAFLNFISWTENGVRYSVEIRNPKLSNEEFIELAEKFEYEK
jgi:outer membrane lipoprotein-sorting protein